MLPENVYSYHFTIKNKPPNAKQNMWKKTVTNKELAPDESFRELNFGDTILCNVTDFVLYKMLPDNV